MENENNPYLENSDLWADWQAFGVTEDTVLEIDFAFITKTQESAREFTNFLNQSGYRADFKEYKIYKQTYGEEMWDITLQMKQTWTVEKLDQQAKEFQRMAEDYNCTIDGIGAMLPQD